MNKEQKRDRERQTESDTHRDTERDGKEQEKRKKRPKRRGQLQWNRSSTNARWYISLLVSRNFSYHLSIPMISKLVLVRQINFLSALLNIQIIGKLVSLPGPGCLLEFRWAASNWTVRIPIEMVKHFEAHGEVIFNLCRQQIWIETVH